MPQRKKALTKIQELTYELTVDRAMTRDVVTVSPTHTIRDLRKILREKRISGTPVVDGGRLVGIMSLERFIRCLSRGEIDGAIGSHMIKKVETVYADEPLVHAIGKFEKFGYGRFPVLDRGTGRMVGILTKGDIIRCLLQRMEVAYHEEEIHRYRASHIFEDISADRVLLEFDFDVEGKGFARAGECASRLKRNLLRLGIAPPIVRRVGIATYEAEMNIVIFTPGGRITAHVDPEKISVRAVDRGPGIRNVEEAMKPGFSTAPDWVRELGFGAGMGLSNIRHHTDRMRLDSGVGTGTTLEFVIYTRTNGDDAR